MVCLSFGLGYIVTALTEWYCLTTGLHQAVVKATPSDLCGIYTANTSKEKK